MIRIALLVAMAGVCALAGEWSKNFSVGAGPVLDIRCGDANVDVKAVGSGRIAARLVTKGWEIRPG